MAKLKSVFICQECGYETSKWLGRCPACSVWGSIVEEVVCNKSKKDSYTVSQNINVISVNEIKVEDDERYTTGSNELDRVLGGGIVRGSLILVGGDPGIGKSTLLLQVCESIKFSDKLLYISGEESVRQIKLRADRLGVRNKELLLISEVNLKVIEALIDQVRPSLVIIDSIQTIYNDEMTSAPGSVSQVREATSNLMRIAKDRGVSGIIVGHVTKEGSIAGPRVLEHMVDTVLYFEGERHLNYRILRAVKNRFGSTNEIGMFEMKEAGLVEVSNPSLFMLEGRPENVSGSVVVASLEGTRPMLIEIQALVSQTVFGVPRRMATGIDYNRITMLMAVLEKKVGMHLGNYDAYINVVGGIKIDEPACDLGIIVAVASSFKNKVVDPGIIFIGEVGLTGEIRGVSNIEKRIMEAYRLGFKKCVIPEGNYKAYKNLRDFEGLAINPASNVQDALDLVFGA